jgi:hypothetical protein
LVADYIERTFILTNKERKLKTKIGVVDFEWFKVGIKMIDIVRKNDI